MSLPCFLLLVAACGDRTYVVVSVEDPNGIADRATTLRFGAAGVELDESRDVSRHRFPLSAALVAKRGTRGLLVVEATNEETVLARGFEEISFGADSATPLRVELKEPCDVDADCDDGVFCNGAESCLRGACEAGDDPCPSPAVDCVDLSCIEEAELCAVKLTAGVDDGDPCTVDACGVGSDVQHVVDSSLEGMPCLLPGASEQSFLCVAGECVPSSCGDGVVDPRTELCDDPLDSDCIACHPRLRPAVEGTRPALSAGGEILGFITGNELVPEDINNAADLYTYDTRDASLMQLPIMGLVQDGRPFIHSDGTRVVVQGALGTFEFDLSTGARETIDGVRGELIDLSADGGRFLFSTTVDLDGEDTNGKPDLYVFDRTSGQTSFVSRGPGGEQGDRAPGPAVISGDGRFVAFGSKSPAFDPTLSDDECPIFVRDLSVGSTVRVAAGAGRTLGSCPKLAISSTGPFVAYERNEHLLLTNLKTSETATISPTIDGQPPSEGPSTPILTPDARFVVYTSRAENLVRDDTNGVTDVFVYERASGETRRILAFGGEEPTDNSSAATASDDGTTIAFEATSDNIIGPNVSRMIVLARNPFL